MDVLVFIKMKEKDMTESSIHKIGSQNRKNYKTFINGYCNESKKQAKKA